MRALGIAARVLAAVVVLLAVLVLGVPNTGFGRRLIETALPRLTSGQVMVQGLSGRFPVELRLARLELRDGGGAWLTAGDVALDWSPARLLNRELRIDRLAAARLEVARLPASSASGSSGTFSLPVSVSLGELEVTRLELGAALAGIPAVAHIAGSFRLASLEDGSGQVSISRLDGPGQYDLSGHADAASVALKLTAREPAQGLASQLAGLPNLGALDATAEMSGPWSAIASNVSIAAGELRASASGVVDAVGKSAVLDVTAQAPAMAPRPDLSWQGIELKAHVSGPFAAPSATGTLHATAISAAGAALREVRAELSGNEGRATVQATLDGLTLPGLRPDIFAAAPVSVHADADLAAPDRPVSIELSHPLLSVRGTLHTQGDLSADIALDLGAVEAFVPELRGTLALQAKAGMRGDDSNLDLSGHLRLTGGAEPAATLLGPDTTLALRAGMRGQDVTLSLLSVQGQFVTLDATGSVAGGVADLSPSLTLSDVSKLAPQLQGTLQAKGRLRGPPDNLAADIDLQGDLATQGLKRAPVTAALHLRGLPGAPAGEVTAQGTLDGSPLNLAATAERGADGTLRANIGKADWKSAHADGALTLAPGAALPQGKVSLRMTRLQDLDRLTGQSLTGSVEATAELDEQARIRARAQARGVMSIDTATLEAEGRQDALALRLTGTGKGAQASAAGTLNAPAKVLTLSALAATWKGERLALQAPARIGFADGVTIDRLALGLRQAVLEVRGRVSPTLDASANLRNLPADLASVAVPGLAVDGSVNAQATLTGTTQLPGGRISVTATGLHLREGPGAAFPPGRLTATATLAGSSARLEMQANVGSAQANISGTAPLNASGALNLQARGNLDLALLDPILTAEGRRARGRVVVDGGISGTPSAPAATGTLALTAGEFQDATQGVRLRAMQALLRGSGNSILIERFSATAGAGTISATGSLGLASPMPLDLRLTARNATPIASDLVRATFDADLAVTGALEGALSAAGKVLIRNAEIRVPESLPANVAVLNVRRPGERPKPPPAPSEISAPVALDVQVNAPGQIFVHGRGLDAELAGSLHVGGTTAAPLVDGGLKLRRGQFSLAGQTLTFSSGSVGLWGGGKIDPTLDFTATSTSGGITATLHVGGTASMPKITLSSVPELPQDEILSRLLFSQSTSKLSPFQIAQMAAGLAEIAGVGGGQQPLNRLRQALGLDRLSVGGSSNGQGASLEAGRYVSPGVYLGAKQSTTGSGTQATVQVDLWKGLKLEADVGASGGGQTAAGSTDTGGSSVGLTWQFEY